MNLVEAVRKAGEHGAIRSKSVPITVGSSGDGWIEAGYFVRNHVHVSHLLLDDWEVKPKEPREWAIYKHPQLDKPCCCPANETVPIGVEWAVIAREVLEGRE